MGPRGANGPTGPAGIRGPQGIQGPTGPAGAVGPMGFQGPRGIQGPTGATGAQGLQGPMGVQGPAGPMGATGPMGIQGPMGPMGATGPQGIQGIPGAQGSTGPRGMQGPTGEAGPQGIQGPTGAQGPRGFTGPQGPQGPAGTLPYPASGNLASTDTQCLASNGFYTPVQLTLYMPYCINLENDGYTITVQKSGLYYITYSITPTSGANVNASVALLLSKGCAAPCPLLLSNRPMTVNNTCVSAGFAVSLHAGDQLYLGVCSCETVALTANANCSANATVSLFQIGGFCE